MYDYKIPDSIKQLLSNAKSLLQVAVDTKSGQSNASGQKETKSITDEFDLIDEKYKGTDAGGLGLDKLKYDAPTDEEVALSANNELAKKYLSEKDNIIDTIAKAYSALEEKKGNLQSNFNSQAKNIDEYYSQRKEDAEKDALKRGLARSSVITGKIEEFDRGKIDDKTKLEQDVNNQLTDLEYKISGLETEKEKALNNFEMLHAAELNNKIKELKKEREDKLAEVLKYNNTVQEKEVNYADKKKDDNASVVLIKQEEKLATAKKYYDGLDKQKALEDFLNNENMKKHLGEYYGYMLNYLNNKK